MMNYPVQNCELQISQNIKKIVRKIFQQLSTVPLLALTGSLNLHFFFSFKRLEQPKTSQKTKSLSNYKSATRIAGYHVTSTKCSHQSLKNTTIIFSNYCDFFSVSRDK